MFTSWEQIKSWIEDNNFPHWVFYKNNPDGRDEKANDKIIDSNNFTVSDMSDKLDMTEKYLRMYGGRVWGVGFKTPNGTQGGLVCEARIDVEPQSGVGSSGMTDSQIGALRESITREVRAQLEMDALKKREADIERREKEFDEEKQTAIGALVHYLAPIGKMLMQQKNGKQLVAGVDTKEDIRVARIVAEAPERTETVEETPAEQEPFTDEEADKLMALMIRFKKVEPQYLELIESVVTMAENGDATYNMAKGFLIK